MDKLGKPHDAGFSRVKPAAPKENPKEIWGILPADRAKPYKTLDIIHRLVDNSEFEQYKEDNRTANPFWSCN
jgi:acetyl-CoA carboxylase carboxyltransferase component